MLKREVLSYYVDFYGKLLTEKQETVLKLYVNEDYSLSEIAEDLGSSRQAVHDLIQRSSEKLTEYENKLGLYRLLKKHEDQLERIKTLLSPLQELHPDHYHKIMAIMDEIIY